MKKQFLMATVFTVLCVGAAFAKGTPVAPMNFTPEQWEQLKTMKPEQQTMAFMKGVHQKLQTEKMNALTPEQRAEVEQFLKDDKAQREAMNARLEKMTKEQKEALKMQFPPHSRRYPALFKGCDGKNPEMMKHFNGHKFGHHNKFHQPKHPIPQD